MNSIGRRNTFDYSLFDQPVESLRWRLPAERFAWSRVQRMSNSAQFINAKLRLMCHFGTLVPSQRASQVSRQAPDRPGDGIPDCLGAVTGEGRSVFDGFTRPVPFHARQMQEHGEAGRAFDQSSDRRTSKAENEVTLPMARHNPVANLSWRIAYHQRIDDECLATVPSAFTSQPEWATGPKTGGELSFRGSTPGTSVGFAGEPPSSLSISRQAHRRRCRPAW